MVPVELFVEKSAEKEVTDAEGESLPSSSVTTQQASQGSTGLHRESNWNFNRNYFVLHRNSVSRKFRVKQTNCFLNFIIRLHSNI